MSGFHHHAQRTRPALRWWRLLPAAALSLVTLATEPSQSAGGPAGDLLFPPLGSRLGAAAAGGIATARASKALRQSFPHGSPPALPAGGFPLGPDGSRVSRRAARRGGSRRMSALQVHT